MRTDFECPRAPRNFLRQLIVDSATVLLLLTPPLCLTIWGKPYKRGFNCDDQSLRYPYQENTISSVTCYLYSTTIPVVLIFLNEFAIIRCQVSSTEVRSTQLSSLHFWRCLLWQAYRFIAPLAFAAASSQLLTDIAKYSIGRLRPHFIDRCRPKLASTGEIIHRSSNCNQPYTYVLEYSCSSGLSERTLRDSHLSFSSGHSAFAAVCLVYLVLYIQRRVQWSCLGLVKPLTQVLLISLVAYTGFSRISDYKHHWSDVLAGFCQGTLVALLVATFVSELYTGRHYRPGSSSSGGSGSITNANQVDPESGV